MSDMGFTASPESCHHRQGFEYHDEGSQIVRQCVSCSFSQVLKEDDGGQLFWQHIPETMTGHMEYVPVATLYVEEETDDAQSEHQEPGL